MSKKTWEEIQNMSQADRIAYKDTFYKNKEIDEIDEIDNMTTDMEPDQRIAFKDGYYAREEEEKQDENFSNKGSSYSNAFKQGYYMKDTDDFKEITDNMPYEGKIGFKDGIEAKEKDNVRNNKLKDMRYYDAYHKGYGSYIKNKKKGGRKRKYKKTSKKGGKKKSRKQKKTRKARR